MHLSSSIPWTVHPPREGQAASEGHLKPSQVHKTGTLTAVGENLTVAVQMEVRKECIPKQGRRSWKGFETSPCGKNVWGIVGRLSGALWKECQGHCGKNVRGIAGRLSGAGLQLQGYWGKERRQRWNRMPGRKQLVSYVLIIAGKGDWSQTLRKYTGTGRMRSRIYKLIRKGNKQQPTQPRWGNFKKGRNSARNTLAKHHTCFSPPIQWADSPNKEQKYG